MELTKQQKEFILNRFFKHEQYPGWKNIATTLIENGQCIVPGEQCIWQGGIGSFIDTHSAEPDAVGCIRYFFSLDVFMKSEWFIEEVEDYESILTGNIKSLETSLKEIQGLKP